jgi:SAM-dependent methyltransferase
MTDLTQTHYKLAIRQAYMEPDVLVVRERTREQYSEPHIDFPRWALSRQNDWRGDEVILDISPGSGSYFEVAQEFFPDGKYIATDLSVPMLRLARKHPRSEDVQLLVTQSEAFPFQDHTFDIVLANNVLY